MLFGSSRKTKATAEVVLKKGDVDKAIKNFEKFLKKTPGDLRVLKQLGDLHREKKSFLEAADVYFRLATETHEQGLFLRAVSACRLVLEVDATHDGALNILGELEKTRTTQMETSASVEEEELEIDADLIVEETEEALEVDFTEDVLEMDEAGVSLEGMPGVGMPGEGMPGEKKPKTAFSFDASDEEEESDLDLSDVEFDDLTLGKQTSSTPEGESLFDVGEWSVDLDFLPQINDDNSQATLAPSKKTQAAQVPVPSIFQHLPDGAFIELVQELTFWEVKDGERIVTQGEYGESFFIVSHGNVRVEREDDNGNVDVICTFGEGDLFGEIAILVRNLRSASVIAEGYVEVLEITRDVTDQLMRRYPETREAIARFSRERVALNVLRSSGIFGALDEDTLKSMAASFTTVTFAKNQAVIQQHEKSPGLFAVLAGDVSITVDDETITQLHEGDVFGEMSIYFAEAANATVTTLTSCQFLHLPTDSFVEWRRDHPTLQKALAQLSKQRDMENRRRAR